MATYQNRKSSYGEGLRVSKGSCRQFDGLHDPTLSKTEIQAQTQDEKLTGAPGLHIVPHMSRLILSPGR